VRFVRHCGCEPHVQRAHRPMACWRPTTTKSGKLGGIEVVLLVRGQAHMGVDLGQMTIESVDETAHSITLSLPPPTVRVAKVDPQRTLFLRHQRYGLWTLVQVEKVDREVVASALSDAQAVVQAAGADPQRKPAAQGAVERALEDVVRQAGWTLHVHWRSCPVAPPSAPRRRRRQCPRRHRRRHA